MEYQVGSLADMISGSSSLKNTKNSKKKTSDVGIKVKFEKVKTSKLHRPTTKKSIERKRKNVDIDSPKKKRLRFSDPLEVARPIGPSAVEGKNVNQVKENVDKNKNITKIKHELDPERDARTIFVGNLMKSTKQKELKSIFSKYGNIETVRFRSASVADPRTSKKVAMIKGELHPGRTNINGYVLFENAESAHNALAANGMVVNDHTLRVDLVGAKRDYDQKKCVFIGNLKFSVEEEGLRKMFESCGKILNVRVVRDKSTGMGKGIAFIDFESSESVELALKLHEEDLMGRPLRVARLKGKTNGSKKGRKRALKPDTTQDKTRNSNNVKEPERKKKKKMHAEKPDAKQSNAIVSEFQGEKTDKKKLKKKKKVNKGELKKKIMQLKLGIIPKSKKIKSTKQN